MTEYFKSLTGEWARQSDGSIKGMVDISQTARSIAGSETDQDYEFYATVKISSGKAALIVNFNYSEDWEERYLEMILDPANDKVTLDVVIRNADGTEQTRQTVASRDMTIDLATEYRCRMISKEIATNVYAVYGFINDFLVAEAEDLAAPFQKGMHGFECLGAENDYTEFNWMALQTSVCYCSLLDVKEIVRVNDAKSDSELLGCIVSAYHWVNDILELHGVTVPLSSPYPQAAVDANKYRAAAVFREREDSAEAEKLYKRAEVRLQAYIEKEEYQPTFRRV